MKRILLCPNLRRDTAYGLTQHVIGLLKNCDASIVLCPIYHDGGTTPPTGVTVSDLDSELDNADMVITFGGDGTILRAARAAADKGVPVLGVNMGDKGFMAELEQEDVGLIPHAVCGDFGLDKRMMLDVELMRGGTVIERDFALNDVVVAGITKSIDLTLSSDGDQISHFSGDGAVVCTPTGSTAYSMAAGGPIIEPSADTILVTPICAHVLTAKAFVLASHRRVTVELEGAKVNPAYLTVDGDEYRELERGDIVNVFKSKKQTLFVQLSNRSFYKKVREKLGEKY